MMGIRNYLIVALSVLLLCYVLSTIVTLGALVDTYCNPEPLIIDVHTEVPAPSDRLNMSNFAKTSHTVTINSTAGFDTISLGSVLGSGSMLPTLDENANIVYESAGPNSSYFIGDIIVFNRPDGGYIIHRIINITSEGYVTKGDNNLIVDHYIVQRDDIDAIVVAILY